MPDENPFDQFDNAQDISTITDQPVPAGEEKAAAGKEAAAGMVRYGVPIAAGIATGGLTTVPNLITNAAAVGLSELSARQIERISEDPDIDSIWRDLEASGAAAGIDLAVGGTLAGLGRGVAALARKAFLPKAIPSEVELANTVLGRLSKSGQQAEKKWRMFIGKNPLALTPGQMSYEERGLVTWLEGIARGGSGQRIMTRFDKQNLDAISDTLGQFFETQTTGKTGPEMGIFFKKLFGFVDDPANIFKPVEAYRGFLYDQYAKELAKYGDTVIDGSKLRDFFRKSTDPDLLKIYSQLKSVDLVPPLEGIEGRVVRKTRVTSTSKTAGTSEKVADVSRTNLLEPETEPSRTFTKTEAATTATGNKTTTTQNIREVLEDSRLTKEQVDEAWQKLNPEQVNDIIRNINDFYSVTDDKFNKRLAHVRSQIEEPFEKFLRENKNLETLRNNANSFYGQKEDMLYKGTLKAIRKTLQRSPSGVTNMFNPLKGDVAARYDNLISLRDGIYFSALTPEVKAGKPSVTAGMGLKRAKELYEDEILKPLRFRFVASAADDFGRLDPGRMLKDIQRIEGEAPEMLKEIWGSQETVKNIREFCSAYETITRTIPEKSIFIQLKTAGAIGASGGAVWGYFSGDSPTTIAGKSAGGAALGAIGILMSPRVLAHALTNTTLTRALTEGVTDSVRFGGITPKLALSLRKLGEMALVSEMFKKAPSADTIDFMTTPPVEEQGQQ